MGGVRFFGGYDAWVARCGPGGGSDSGEIWRVDAPFQGSVGLFPWSGGRVVA